MIGLGLSITQRAVLQMLGFSPNSLFSAGEQGVWYDPSDMSTMFQDAAGTTPVTAVEQPVGRILDKSGRGNHATQTTATSRPVLSARINQLLNTEQFDGSAWVKVQASVSANTAETTDPIGGNTADTIFESSISSGHLVRQGFTAIAGATYKISVFAKSAGRQYLALVIQGKTERFFDVLNGVVLGAGAQPNTGNISPAGNGWYLCSIEWVSDVSGPLNFEIYTSNTGNSVVYPGDPSKGIYIWGADLRASNDGIGLPAYQRVNTATDYDTAGFPMYLRFDGVDDWLVTPTIDFTSTDKMTVFAGVRKLSDAARGSVVELTTSTAANNGAFQLTAPESASATFAFISKGTTQSTAIASSLPAPITRVLSGIADIAGDSVILRANGAQVAIGTADQGTGNFANAPMFIGRRGGTTLPFNGRIYSLIIRGAQSTAQQIASAEAWVNSKTGAY